MKWREKRQKKPQKTKKIGLLLSIQRNFCVLFLSMIRNSNDKAHPPNGSLCKRNHLSAFQSQAPHPRGELNHSNLFTLLVAVVLSAQATDKGVNKATTALFAIADTPQKMLGLGLDRLKDLIKTIGLYHSKARHIIGLSQALIERHDGQVPDNREQLQALPGVGRKTANVVLNIGFGHPTIAVDTHLFRVSNRTGLAPGRTPLEVEKKLCSRVPEWAALHAHHWLILHGRYVCKARKPACSDCIIADLCMYPAKTTSKPPH